MNRPSLSFTLSGILLAGAAYAEEATLPSQEQIRQQVREEAQNREQTMALRPDEREARQAERQANRQGGQGTRGSQGRRGGMGGGRH